MITVALPTWNNQRIIDVAMMGLSDQIDAPDWELIISECWGVDLVGGDYFKKWASRLKKANCKRIVYVYNRNKKPLNQKWLQIAEKAKGGIFLLQSSDDYSHNHRLQLSGKYEYDWYHNTAYYAYHIALDKLIIYDQINTPGKDHNWKTGFNIAVKTDIIKKIISNESIRYGVDHWLFNYCNPKKIHEDRELYKTGLSTTGLNTISRNRYNHFIQPKFPFKGTDKNITDIDASIELKEKLKYLKKYAVIDRPKIDNSKIMVKFKRDMNGRRKGQKTEIYKHAFSYYWFRDAIELLQEQENQKEYELNL